MEYILDIGILDHEGCNLNRHWQDKKCEQNKIIYNEMGLNKYGSLYLIYTAMKVVKTILLHNAHPTIKYTELLIKSLIKLMINFN